MLGFVLLLTLAKLVYLGLLSPYELVGDEAHYWDWSRRPALSYYTKGPGIAWSIGVSTALLGTSEWGVRAFGPLYGAVTILAAAALAARIDRRVRAAWYAGIAVCLAVVLHAITLLMTIDGPYVACWSVAALAGWLLLEHLTGGRARAGRATLLGAGLGLALGIGFLFKYTILVLPIGIGAYALLRRREMPRGPALAALAATLAVLLVATLPVLAWNAQHDWVTIRHLAGHLGLAWGDVPPEDLEGKPWRGHVWVAEFALGQIAMVGPAMVLVVGSCARVLRRPRRRCRDLYLVACGLPILVFYLGVSLVTEPEGNWPIAGYVPLLALVGRHAGVEIERHRRRVARWLALPPDARPRAGVLRRKPESGFQLLWHWSAAYVVVGVLGLVLLLPASRLPVLDEIIPEHRFSGFDAMAAAADRALDAERPTARPPLIIANRYDTAALLAFYMEGRPVVRSAAKWMGDRGSSYDHFADTRLDDPSIVGRPALLVGTKQQKWSLSDLRLAGLRTIDADAEIVWADRFGGVTADDD